VRFTSILTTTEMLL